MQENSRHNFKGCWRCGALNPIPDSEPRAQFFQCDNCGENNSLKRVPSIADRMRKIKPSRRTFIQIMFSFTLSLTSWLTAPWWNNQYNMILNGKKEIDPEFPSISIQPEPAVATGFASAGAVVIGVAKAG